MVDCIDENKFVFWIYTAVDQIQLTDIEDDENKWNSKK